MAQYTRPANVCGTAWRSVRRRRASGRSNAGSDRLMVAIVAFSLVPKLCLGTRCGEALPHEYSQKHLRWLTNETEPRWQLVPRQSLGTRRDDDIRALRLFAARGGGGFGIDRQVAAQARPQQQFLVFDFRPDFHGLADRIGLGADEYDIAFEFSPFGPG